MKSKSRILNNSLRKIASKIMQHFLVIALLFLFSSSLLAQNLALNPGFETQTSITGSSTPWAGWGTLFQISNVLPQEGVNSCFISNFAGVEQIVTGLTANTNYVLNAWVRDSIGSMSVGVKKYTVAGQSSGSDEIKFSTTNQSWTNTAIAFKTDANTTTATIFLFSNTNCSGWGDNISLTLSPADAVAPTTPTNVSSSEVTSNSFKLSWTASTDNVAVSAYDIYKDGVLFVTTPNGLVTSMYITNLNAATDYSVTVIARDAAGNSSVASTANVVTTRAAITDANIALNKTATASTQQTSNPATSVNDGNVTTSWAASNGYTPGDWVKIDLGASYNITGVEILWKHPEWINKYTIYVSNDNTNWVLASDKSSNTYFTSVGGASEINYFNSNGYRYIRLTVTGWGNGGFWAAIYELRVFGALAVTTGTKDLETTALKIYPNPADEYLKVENLKADAEVLISSLNGIVLSTKKATNNGSLNFSVKNWAKGVYLLRVKDDSGIAVKKFIIR